VKRAVRSLASRKRILRLVMPAAAATLVTASVVGVSVARSQHQAVQASDVAAKPVEQNVALGGRDESVYQAERVKEFSRSTDRVTLREKPDVTDHKFRTVALNLWPAPREKGKPLDVLPSGGKVAVTGVKKSGFAQILYGGQVRWVNQDYLADKMPVEKTSSASRSPSSGGSAPTAGVSTAPCPDGSGTESGLTPSAVTLFRAVCNAFPPLTTYGGYSNHGEHSSGRAIDFMINGDSALGQQIADWARAHASELNLYDVIWQQHIWTPERSSEGWRSMPDRGSPTANHFDHVHISVN
jgi:SH3 domain-containing protein